MVTESRQLELSDLFAQLETALQPNTEITPKEAYQIAWEIVLLNTKVDMEIRLHKICVAAGVFQNTTKRLTNTYYIRKQIALGTVHALS